MVRHMSRILSTSQDDRDSFGRTPTVASTTIMRGSDPPGTPAAQTAVVTDSSTTTSGAHGFSLRAGRSPLAVGVSPRGSRHRGVRPPQVVNARNTESHGRKCERNHSHQQHAEEPLSWYGVSCPCRCLGVKRTPEPSLPASGRRNVAQTYRLRQPLFPTTSSLHARGRMFLIL